MSKLHPASLPVSRMEQPAWRKRFLAQRQGLLDPTRKLLWLGDSIVAQFEMSGRKAWDNYRPVWEQYYTRRLPVNLGINGDNTAHLLWRIENSDFSASAPRLAILLIGANNFGAWKYDANSTFDAIELIVQRLRACLATTKVLVIGVLPSSRGPWVETQTRLLNSRLAARFTGTDDCYFRDLDGVFLRDGIADPACFVDRFRMPPMLPLHPTSEAQARMAEALEPTVERLWRE